MRAIPTTLSTLLSIVLLHLPAVAGPIHDAAKIGDAVQVESLTAAGTSVNEMDALDKTALVWASENGHIEVAQFLVGKGADLNIGDFTGQGPLYWAARMGNKEIVEILIEAGADVNQQDLQGVRPLDKPTNKGREAVIKMLKDAGAKCGTDGYISRACTTAFGQSE